MSTPFIGRTAELTELRSLQQSGISSLVIIQGRRRVGKSRLIEEFAKNQKFYSFAGMAPDQNTTAQMQRDEFARQLSEQFHLPKFIMQDWGDLFTLLSQQLHKGKIVVLFDEISWMGSLDPTFLAKLKNAWDIQFKKNQQLMLVLCGSVSSWIEKNIISNTLFLGRPSLHLKLRPLTLTECNQFWKQSRNKISAYEKLKILSVTGGIPRYLELLNINQSAENNLKRMCFSPNAPLLDEFDRIFSDIFGKKTAVYKKIIGRLSLGPATQEQIMVDYGRSKSGDFSEYLHDLEIAGFISRDFTWNLKTSKISKLSQYRLSDNYVRFYLKCIQPNKTKINKNIFADFFIGNLPAWEGIMGLQFETLVLNNDLEVIKALEISMEEVSFCNPFFQKTTKRKLGCQIDLLIQTKFNTLFVGEIKFSKSLISTAIIDEVQQKIDRLDITKNFSIRPVLIHVNGVQDGVTKSGFFANIIDFGELLE